MNYLLTIFLSIAVSFSAVVGAYNYLPLGVIEKFSKEPVTTFGADITTINASDTIRSSRSVINTNFTNLNNFKIENSSSSIDAITTLSNLVTVGTLTSGALGSGFTTVAVAQGGTGSTTLASNLVLLGNGTGNVNVVNGTGADGQFLVSQGAGLPPNWETSVIDQAGTYSWTGGHTFRFGSTTISSATLNLGGIELLTPLPGISTASGSVFALGASNQMTLQSQGLQLLGQNSGSGATVTVSSLPYKSYLKIFVSIAGQSASTSSRLLFNCCGKNEYRGYATSTGEDGNKNKDDYFFRLGPASRGAQIYTIEVSNPLGGATKYVTWTGTQTQGNQDHPYTWEGSAEWASTTDITEINLTSDGATTFNSGTRVWVWGR